MRRFFRGAEASGKSSGSRPPDAARRTMFPLTETNLTVISADELNRLPCLSALRCSVMLKASTRAASSERRPRLPRLKVNVLFTMTLV